MTDDWDRDYFERADEREAERAKPRVVASVGLPTLNPVELELIMQAESTIMARGLDRVGFTDFDEDSGEEVILVPVLTDAESQMVDMIYDSFEDDVRLARSMGKGGTWEKFRELRK